MSRKNKTLRAFLHQTRNPTIKQAWDAAWKHAQKIFHARSMRDMEKQVADLQAENERLHEQLRLATVDQAIAEAEASDAHAENKRLVEALDELRERCAQECERLASTPCNTSNEEVWALGALACADEIRAMAREREHDDPMLPLYDAPPPIEQRAETLGVVYVDGVGAGRKSLSDCRDGVRYITIADTIYWPLSADDAQLLLSAECGRGEFTGPTSLAQQRPVECSDGCPPQQVCDYCQIAALSQQPVAPSEAVNVLGMPEFDGLLDHIYEYGTGAEGVIEKANAFARAIIARYAPQQPREQQPVPDVSALVEALETVSEIDYDTPIDDTDTVRLWAACDGIRRAKLIAVKALAAHRKQGGEA